MSKSKRTTGPGTGIKSVPHVGRRHLHGNGGGHGLNHAPTKKVRDMWDVRNKAV